MIQINVQLGTLFRSSDYQSDSIRISPRLIRTGAIRMQNSLNECMKSFLSRNFFARVTDEYENRVYPRGKWQLVHILTYILPSQPRKFSNLVLLRAAADPCDKVVRLPVIFLFLFCCAVKWTPRRVARSIPVSLSLSRLTGTTRSLFDNGVSRKLEGLYRWSNALTNYLTERGLDGRDKQFMSGYSTADGPSVHRRRPLSPAFNPLVLELFLNVKESIKVPFYL